MLAVGMPQLGCSLEVIRSCETFRSLVHVVSFPGYMYVAVVGFVILIPQRPELG